MEKRYASAGPNKQMYDMYNLSMRNTVEGSQGQVTGLASLSALQDAAMPDGQGAQSQANFANPGLLAARVDQNSMSTSAIQYENQRMQEEDDAERGKPGTANPRPNADFGTDSVFRVVSRDGQRQVSSTHADEVRDQVRAQVGAWVRAQARVQAQAQASGFGLQAKGEGWLRSCRTSLQRERRAPARQR